MVQHFLLRLPKHSLLSPDGEKRGTRVTMTMISRQNKSAGLTSQVLIIASQQSPRVSIQGFNCCEPWAGGWDTCIVILALSSATRIFAEVVNLGFHFSHQWSKVECCLRFLTTWLLTHTPFPLNSTAINTREQLSREGLGQERLGLPSGSLSCHPEPVLQLCEPSFSVL